MLYVIVIAIPIIVITVYTFDQLKQISDEKLEQDLDYYMTSTLTDIQNKIDAMETLSLLVQSEHGMKEFVGDNMHLSAEENLFFKDNFAYEMERLSNANPEIYHLRMYSNNDSLLEMWPVLYREDRLSGQTWQNEIPKGRLMWSVYAEELKIPATQHAPAQDDYLVAVYSEIKYGLSSVGYLEIGMKVSTFFYSMYQNNELNNNGFTIIIDQNGEMHYNVSNNFINSKNINMHEAKKILSGYTSGEKSGIYKTSIDGEDVLVAYQYIEKLDSYIYTVDSMGDYSIRNNEQRDFFLAMGLVLIVILSLLTYAIVSILLGRLNKVIAGMREFQNGKMDVHINISGKDEAAEVASHMNKMLSRVNELVGLVIKKQESVKDAEIKALQTQINAHFIYNTLETIKMMAEIEQQFMISDSITSLGRLIRYSMNWHSASVSLIDELNYARDYIALLNIRRDNQITLNVDVEQSFTHYRILKMTVQPIIENAVLHGIEPYGKDAVIKVSVFYEDENVVIEISDSGVGMTDEQVEMLQYSIDTGITSEYKSKGCGIGLRNINERIQLFYGNEYGLKLISVINCFTKVRIVLPQAHKLYDLPNGLEGSE